MDELKSAVVRAIKQTVKDNLVKVAEAIGRNLVDVEFHEIDNLNMAIRVDQLHVGPRYFNIKISESY